VATIIIAAVISRLESRQAGHVKATPTATATTLGR
jgi:hypothetical protein